MLEVSTSVFLVAPANRFSSPIVSPYLDHDGDGYAWITRPGLWVWMPAGLIDLARDASSMSYRSRAIAAGVNLALTVYATFTVTSVKLLHCVHVPGTDKGVKHLFLQVLGAMGSVQAAHCCESLQCAAVHLVVR
jgi:hypothetical protein